MSDKKPSTRRRAPKMFFWPKHGYYSKNNHGEWQATEKETAKKLLIQAGFMSHADTNSLSPASRELLKIEQSNSIHYAGTLSGYATGHHDVSGFRILVTGQRRLIKPKDATPELWLDILATQYGPDLPWLLSWLKGALERVKFNGGPMLPALILSGGPDRGKSLVQNHLITPLLGGRMAKPYRYWTGQTTFNEDLCGAEHLMVEDEVAPMKEDRRRMFGDNVKAAVANETTSLHPKGGRAITVRCLWCVSISTNEEPHNLRMLPLTDGSLSDKLILLRVLNRPACLPKAGDYEAFIAFGQKLKAELPAFVHFLEEFKVPQKCQGQRSVVGWYRNPDLMALVSEDDKVTRLLWLLDHYGIAMAMDWTGTAHDLEAWLREACRYSEADKLLASVPVGYLLRDAAKRYPDRIRQDGQAHNNVTRWRISPKPVERQEILPV